MPPQVNCCRLSRDSVCSLVLKSPVHGKIGEDDLARFTNPAFSSAPGTAEAIGARGVADGNAMAHDRGTRSAVAADRCRAC